MGPGISSNYDNITYVFNAGCWKVHSAIHKVDNERVCLWEIDKDELDKMITDEAMQNEYLQKLLDGIQKCKKLFLFLKSYESDDMITYYRLFPV